VIELDPRTTDLGEATLVRVNPNGTVSDVLSAALGPWGKWLRYQYATFDFSRVAEPGMYMVRYRAQQTPPFRIGRDVLKSGVWQPTLESYLPVQMCHVAVHGSGIVWHGACHLDDALQAPAPLVPTGNWTPAETLDHFLKSRAKTIAFLESTPDLREHAADSPLGQPLDAYEWLLFIGAHSERHTKQILEVKADPGFPKN